jgi:hypothetical protein
MTQIMDFALRSVRDEEDFLVYETPDSWREHADPKSTKKRKPRDKGLPESPRRRGGPVDLGDISDASGPVSIPTPKIKTEDDDNSLHKNWRGHRQLTEFFATNTDVTSASQPLPPMCPGNSDLDDKGPRDVESNADPAQFMALVDWLEDPNLQTIDDR